MKKFIVSMAVMMAIAISANAQNDCKKTCEKKTAECCKKAEKCKKAAAECKKAEKCCKKACDKAKK